MLRKLIKIADDLDNSGLSAEAEALDEIIRGISGETKMVYISGSFKDSSVFDGLKSRVESTLPIKFVFSKPVRKNDIKIAFDSYKDNKEVINIFSSKYENGVQYFVEENEVDNYINYLVEDIKVGLEIK